MIIKNNLSQCPYDEATKCAMNEPCRGCEIFAEHENLSSKEAFQPEYFTGLLQDVERAKQYIGKVMEFSDDGKYWFSGILEYARNRSNNSAYPHNKYKRSDVGCYIYCRTCSRTFEEQKRFIEFPAGKLPAPERVKPKLDKRYFYLSAEKPEGYEDLTWEDDSIDNQILRNGIWLKESDVQQVAEWWRKTFG